jgi:hypothetical protein
MRATVGARGLRWCRGLVGREQLASAFSVSGLRSFTAHAGVIEWLRFVRERRPPERHIQSARTLVRGAHGNN